MKLFTKTVCPKCMLIKSMLDESGVEYEVVNIDHDADSKNTLVKQNIMSVPVLLKDGKYFAGNEINKIISEYE